MGKLLAGAAKRDIAPDIELLLAISELEKDRPMGNVYDGIHEHGYVRVIAVSDGEKTALLVGYDLVKAPLCGVITRRFKEEFGVDPDNTVFAATHNHEHITPALDSDDDYSAREPKGPVAEPVREYSQWWVEQVVECAREAIANMKPAKMGFKKGESFINACRDFATPIGPIQANNFHGPSDHELLLIQFTDLEDNIIGMFVNFACHSNYMVWNVYNRTYPKMGIDLGGTISRFVERLNGDGFPVIWAQGAAGDQNPITRSVWRILDVDDDGKLYYYQHVFNWKDNLEQMKSLAATQGLEILELSKQIDNYTDECDFKGGDTWRSIPGRVPYRQLGIYGDMSPVHKKELPPIANQIQVGDKPEPVPLGHDIKLHFRLFKLNGVSFASFGGEAYCTLGKIIKEMMPTEATAVVTVSYGDAGYIADRDNEWRNGYGAAATMAWSGAMVNNAFESAFSELKEKLGM